MNRRRLKNSPVLKFSIFAVLALVCVPLIFAASSSPVHTVGTLAAVGTLLPFGSKSATIADLQTKNTALTEEGQKLQDENEKLKGQVSTLTAEREGSQKALDAEKARADKATADLATAQSKFDADLKAANDKHAADLKAAQEAHEAKVNAEVTQRLAAAGGDPIEKDPKAKGAGDPATKTEQPVNFDGMSAVQLIGIGMKAALEKRKAA